MIRLVGITNPPLEQDDNWQHVYGLMVARNFLEIDNDIRYPRLDDTYGYTGIRAGDFPLLSYSHYLVSAVFGYTHWYGRLINLVVSTLGIWCFYLIVTRYFNVRVGLMASLVLIMSIWFAYSRTLSNDVFGVSLMMIGLYFGLSFFREQKSWQLFISVLFSGLGVLSCLPASIFALVYVIPLWQYRKEWKLWMLWLLGTSLVFVAVYEWYLVWSPYLIEVYNDGYSNAKSIYEVLSLWKEILPYLLKLFGLEAFQSLVLLGCAIGGILWVVVRRQWLVLFMVMLLSVGYFIFFLNSNFFEYPHNYYVIPLVPVMALMAGYGLANIKRQLLWGILLVVGMLESVVNQWDSLVIKESERYVLEIESIADKISEPTDLIAVYSEGNPYELYLAHRKGMLLNEALMGSVDVLYATAGSGGKFIFVNKHKGLYDMGMDTVFISEHYIVYDLGVLMKPYNEEELRELEEFINQ